MNEKGIKLFYVWGHAYEFDMFDNWDRIEEFCKRTGGRADVWYCTNIEVCSYIKAYESLVFGEEIIYNPSDTDVVLYDGSKDICVGGYEIVELK